jgi:hypothetical protein
MRDAMNESRCLSQAASCLLEAVRRAFVIAVWLVFAPIFAARPQAQQATVYGYDLNGKPIAELATPETQAVVLLFIATDCPVSNRYAPEFQRLSKEFLRRPVVFWLVYPNATETAEGVLRHQAAFGLEGPTVLRPSQWLIAEAQATITPEAAVLVPAGSAMRTVYAGRIDNRYIDIGKERPRATRHDLEDAVEAVLAHERVTPPGGPPVGCGIVSQAALGKP